MTRSKQKRPHQKKQKRNTSAQAGHATGVSKHRAGPPRFLLYGVTGYTGMLTAKRARELGMRPILAGRNRTKLQTMADQLGFEFRVASSDDRFALDLAIRDVDAVLNIAGPFSRTASVVADTCLRHGVHYLDVTGEIEVMQQLSTRHERAVAVGVMVMPGTGFAVVPSDCLAAQLSARLPDARHLRIGLNAANFVSRGTAKTMVEMISNHVTIRREGQLRRIPFGSLERSFDFGEGPRISTAMSWGDVFTAFHTTGIHNIDVSVEAGPWQKAMYQYTSTFSWLLKTRPCQFLMELQADTLPEVPTAPLPGRVIVAEVSDDAGNRVVSRLHTDDGYSFSAVSSLAVVQKILDGDFIPGYQTPAGVYGPDFVLGLEGVRMDVLEATAA